jgi:subtilisin family serine protease
LPSNFFAKKGSDVAAHFDTRKLKFRSRCFGPTSITVMSVSALSVLALLGCATRRYNSQTASQANVQANDPGEYFAVPGAVGKDGFIGFLIVTKPGLTHPTFVETEKMVAEQLPKWKLKPWGTGRYSHMAFVPVDNPELLDAAEDREKTLEKLKKAGGKKLQSVQGITTGDLSPTGIAKLDAIALHQSNESIFVADVAPEGADPKDFTVGGIFREQRQERLDTTDPTWSLKFGRVFEAWRFIQKREVSVKSEDADDSSEAQVLQMGQGVKIGVIDTGYLPEHHEFQRSKEINNNVKLGDGVNVLDPTVDPTPIDQFVLKGSPANPGHGSAVVGVLNATLPKKDKRPMAFTTGIAPGAEVFPVRASISTVYKNPFTIAKAIRDLIEKKVHIISISLGGPPENSLQLALEKAQRAGIIVVAAAGNGTQLKLGDFSVGGFAVFPSVYPTVIAVGAGNIECKVWGQSAPAEEVDVLAPGENVWYPASYKGSDSMIWSLRRGSGTSFATPYVAAAAALWIQANGGFEKLAAKYGVDSAKSGGRDLSGIPKAFEVALKYQGLKFPMSHPTYEKDYSKTKYCTGFDPKLEGRSGAGFIDVFNLVKAPLPTVEQVQEPYAPNLSKWGEDAIRRSNKAQFKMFQLVTLDPKVEGWRFFGLMKQAGKTREHTRWFVLQILHDKYFGSGTETGSTLASEDDAGLKDAMKENEKFLGVAASCARALGNAVKAVFDRPELRNCDIDFFNLARQYPSIDPNDSSYFVKAFQYLAEAKQNRGEGALNADDKRWMIDALLAGRDDWMPE